MWVGRGVGPADGQNSEINLTFSKKVFRLISGRWGGAVPTAGGLQVTLAPILGPTREPGLGQEMNFKVYFGFFSEQPANSCKYRSPVIAK